MELVQPKAFFLGEFQLHFDHSGGTLGGVRDWLEAIGGAEAIGCLDHMNGSDIEQLIELAARRCYKSFAPGLNPNVSKIRTDSEEYQGNIIKQRHGSVQAHGHCTYAFENVSRVFTAEACRNSTGNDISQESLRYVRLNNIKFWIPEIISREKEIREVTDPWDSACTIKQTPEEIFRSVVETCEWAQKALAEYYDIENIKDFATKKILTSAFRRVAPCGLATGIVMTFNIRSLRWIIEQRTSRAAEEEIRIVFGMVAEDAIKRWPMVFQDFEKVDSGDGLYEYVPKYSKI